MRVWRLLSEACRERRRQWRLTAGFARVLGSALAIAVACVSALRPSPTSVALCVLAVSVVAIAAASGPARRAAPVSPVAAAAVSFPKSSPH
jgi:uncharacterized membrane protein YgaE (UPF0421/DUF939 family)